MLEKLGGRKYILSVLILVIGGILVALGQLPAEQWITFAEVILGTYAVSNVANKAVK